MRPKISVCMAVRNGETYLHEQLTSILPQLAGDDEIIISDDNSGDQGRQIINSLNDARIRTIVNPGEGLLSNFENALRHSNGEYIFLADQDDVWKPQKIGVMANYLKTYDLVVSDCQIVNQDLTVSRKSFFEQNRSGKGVVRNLMKNSYMGCCMAFQRKVLTQALPFPEGIPMHDLWIGLVSELYFKVMFIDENLVSHRRHASNASTSGGPSRNSIQTRIATRLTLVKKLIKMKYAR